MNVREGFYRIIGKLYPGNGKNNNVVEGAGKQLVNDDVVVPLTEVDTKERMNSALWLKKPNTLLEGEYINGVYVGSGLETVRYYDPETGEYVNPTTEINSDKRETVVERAGKVYRNHSDCILDKGGKLNETKLYSIYENTYGTVRLGDKKVLRDDKLNLFKAAVKDYIQPSSYSKLEHANEGETIFDQRASVEYAAYDDMNALSRYNRPDKLNEIITNIASLPDSEDEPASSAFRSSVRWGAKNYGLLLDYILKDFILVKVDHKNNNGKVNYKQLDRGTIDSQVLFNFVKKLKRMQEFIYS